MSQETAGGESQVQFAAREASAQTSHLGTSLLMVMPVAATQLGFACGLFLLVPLGNRIDRRKFIPGQAAVLIVFLGAFASAAQNVPKGAL